MARCPEKGDLTDQAFWLRIATGQSILFVLDTSPSTFRWSQGRESRLPARLPGPQFPHLQTGDDSGLRRGRAPENQRPRLVFSPSGPSSPVGLGCTSSFPNVLTITWPHHSTPKLPPDKRPISDNTPTLRSQSSLPEGQSGSGCLHGSERSAGEEAGPRPGSGCTAASGLRPPGSGVWGAYRCAGQPSLAPAPPLFSFKQLY